MVSSITSVSIVDDDPVAREAFSERIEEYDWTPHVLESLPRSPGEAVETLRSESDFALCDLHLQKHAFSEFNGDTLVTRAYDLRYPAILCTNIPSYGHDLSRADLRKIPVILELDEIEPDALARGVETFQLELEGKFRPERKPRRTLVRVDEIVGEGSKPFALVVVPAWHTLAKIRVYLDEFPDPIRESIGDGQRMYAKTNLGAEETQDLFFVEWETG